MTASMGTNYFAELSEYVSVSLTNEYSFAILADCIGNPNIVADVSNIFAPGCIMIRNDINVGNNLYYNSNTIASPVWTNVNQSTGGSGIINQTKITATGASSYTLPFTPLNDIVIFTVDGLQQTPGTDYSLSGKVLTILASPLWNGNTLVVTN